MQRKDKTISPKYCGKRLWILEILLALSWYAVTAIESWFMGVHPLARRAFTTFDYVLFIILFAVVIYLNIVCKRRKSAARPGL